MTLQLEKVHLQNWKCYQDQTIEFNLDRNQHIWIIFGQNGFGKTSILEAILWCLYGGISSTSLDKYFNRVRIKHTPNPELSVQLNLRRGKTVYQVSRSARRFMRGNTPVVNADGEAMFVENGIIQQDSRIRIESLLPRDCKDFFFFDGVEIKRYAQLTQTKETQDAIERILGIPELRNLRSDAGKALETIERSLNDVASASKELTEVTEQLADIQEQIETKFGQLELAKQDANAAEAILRDSQALASQMEELKGKFDELRRLDREQARSKEELNRAEKLVEDAIKQTPVVLMQEFIREMSDDLQTKSITKAKRSGSVSQLRELLNSETCLCGRCIDEDARFYILQHLEQLENSGKLTQEALRQDGLSSRLMSLARYSLKDLDDLLLRRDRLRDEIEEVKQAAYRLRRETEGINEDEAADRWRKVVEAEQMLKERKSKIERLDEEVISLQQQEDQLRRKRETLAGQDQQTATLLYQAKLARGLSKAADDLIKWRIAESKEIIEEKTSELHRCVTNKPEEYIGIEVKDNYTLGIKTVTGEVLDPEMLSAGEKEALAFSFIAGLNLASGTAAPLIMDTPFGHLDTKHQRNLVNSLPNIPSQVVVLATDRDFPEHLFQELRPYVAGVQTIKRLGATEDASAVEGGT